MAADWMTKAAEGHNANAMSQLAARLEIGLSGKSDLPLSFSWRRRAADSGLPVMLALLARSYREGIGCAKDETMAANLMEKARTACKGDSGLLAQVERTTLKFAGGPGGFGAGLPKSDKDRAEGENGRAVVDTPKFVRAPGSPRRGIPQPTLRTDAKIVLIDVTITEAGFGDTVYIDGKLKNVSDETLKSVMVDVTLETARGQFLGTSPAIVSPSEIEPGDTATFKVIDSGHPTLGHVRLNFVSRQKAIPWTDRSGKRVHPDG
jgi:hypothetical protein